MNAIKNFALILILLSLFSLEACKSKKKLMKNQPATVAVTPAPQPQQQPTATPAPAQAETPAPKPDYHFSNIQFEFNSSVLKTESYPELDKVASALKADPTVKFVLNGNASAEGTPEYNMQLSIDRANAVKAYLVNSGVNSSSLQVKGYGETRPIASNDTEEGRILNRRVEIKKID